MPAWREHDVGPDSTSAIVGNLEPFRNYSVRVAARTGAGAGAYSDPVHCGTPEAVPEAPEDIKALVLAPDAILVSWLPPAKVRGVLQRYTVYSRLHAYAENQPSGVGMPARPVAVPSSQFWHETRGLRTGQRYEFWVTASTGAGEGPATRIVTQSPEIRAPARIASFSRDVTVALKHDLELPCRTAGANSGPSGRARGLQEMGAANSFPPIVRGGLQHKSVAFWAPVKWASRSLHLEHAAAASGFPVVPLLFYCVQIERSRRSPRLFRSKWAPGRSLRTRSAGGGPLRENERLRVLPSGTLRIETAEPEDAANYSCHAHNLYGRDAVHYTVQVHPPQRPASVSVLSTTSSSITLGWLKRNPPRGVTAPRVKEYELHYKRQQGSWDLVRVSPPPGPEAAVSRGSPPGPAASAAAWANGTWLSHELTGLFCGTQYHIYIVAVAERGRSEPSDTVFARTQGKVPASPKRESFVSPNASSLTLRPASWSPGPSSCPVSHLSVEYRARESVGPWLVASRALQPREGPMTLHHLRPDTWYSLRVTAHTDAGPAVAEYAVRTLPASATLAGERTFFRTQLACKRLDISRILVQ
ncbi:hypothetical protein HPB48_004380 [Haemaphysalis longicornis]|uniref:Down syndrome cell adhesion molecule-like protein Dscam2 n=1 Tax=Haemaphysalis longicornis TaxID=44386 RepID=A0A9J6G260_HAELO|nr:hypothetical protein HPB48_004380 [Haemaphysalis longicornis]